MICASFPKLSGVWLIFEFSIRFWISKALPKCLILFLISCMKFLWEKELPPKICKTLSRKSLTWITVIFFCSKNRFNLFVLCSSAFDTLDHPKIAFCFRSHPLLKPWTSKQSYFSWLQIFLASCVSSQENSYAN